MTKEFAIERLKLFVKHYEGENKEVFEMAIEALEKQIPKKLGDVELNEFFETLTDCDGKEYISPMVNVYGSCKSCGFSHERNIPKMMYYHADEIEKKVLSDHCWKCGQAIDWSNDNDNL